MIKWLALLAGDIEMNEHGNENEWKSGKRAAAIELCTYLHDFFVGPYLNRQSMFTVITFCP